MDLTEFKKQLLQTVLSLKEDLKSIRTGTANPSIIEQLVVDAYGGSTKLKLTELATITTEGPSALLIVPFDPNTITDIEKAILKSPLGLSPQVQGTKIVIRIPALSEEQREKYVKLVAQKVEEKKNVVRNHRDDVRKKIKISFDAKDMTEDDKYRLEKEIDIHTQKINGELLEIKEAKEGEIRKI
ncbi:MAG: ribosome-recycling factor [Patescibacteria group bacterium]